MTTYRTQTPPPPAAHPADDTLGAWLAWLRAQPEPVVLLEGTRELPDADRPKLAALAERLAHSLPQARFRSGNAPGSDEAFAGGVARADPRRLQLVLPYAGHRKQMIPGGAYPVSLASLVDAEAREVAEATRGASPEYASLLARSAANPRLSAKSAYLLRDTVKVLGHARLDLAPAAAALFYVNPANPEGGGTGHTRRVCRLHGVPFLDQRAWLRWLDAPVSPRPEDEVVHVAHVAAHPQRLLDSVAQMPR